MNLEMLRWLEKFVEAYGTDHTETYRKAYQANPQATAQEQGGATRMMPVCVLVQFRCPVCNKGANVEHEPQEAHVSDALINKVRLERLNKKLPEGWTPTHCDECEEAVQHTLELRRPTVTNLT